MRPSCESKFNGVYDYFFWCSAFVYQNLRQSSRPNKAVQCFLCAYKAPLFIMMHTAVMWLTWLRTWRRDWFVIVMPGDHSEASCLPVQFCLLASGESWCVYRYLVWWMTKWISELDEQWIYNLTLLPLIELKSLVGLLDTILGRTSPRVHSA